MIIEFTFECSFFAARERRQPIWFHSSIGTSDWQDYAGTDQSIQGTVGW